MPTRTPRSVKSGTPTCEGLRAFGAPRGALLAIVWLELFVLVAIGILAGFGIGYTAAMVISQAVVDGSGLAMPVGFAREDIAFAVTLLGFSALIASVPAIFAYRQSPASALRG
ncbi:ABC-type antimicrobial peptide transport system, permease component [Sinorhizobium americanum]|uniref:ABC-type antimicrobial peptide transport system, permease component n=1 Tax=Sinorhizobium americanum TaxID=194963 RepID=A0A1L3LQL2_9HYPH|nr:ABC-type antimicrobial peptide transport system, permease component [Sinorhizobium americanum CCGM7]APG92365.1 ABC-type antimicrobial peptide transport system, permease component [Sinorhizobium americanum]OAP41701.1 hypothetical protein ATC00_07820 [Sinorhizobium americanum]TCN28457.1 FtsX-like permease family protein [Sinorhizobium americanum]